MRRSGTQLIYPLILIITFDLVQSNLPPSFVQTIDLSVISENTPIGTSINQLIATDPENSKIVYGIEGTSVLEVNPKTGVVVVKELIDREQIGDSIKFWVTAEDNVGKGHENNKLKVPVTIIILDENDTPPKLNVNQSLTINLKEDAPIGTQITPEILAIDKDVVGSILQVFCVEQCPEAFRIEVINEQTTNELIFAIYLAKNIEFTPNHNKYIVNLVVNDGKHNTSLKVEVLITNVQNKPPVFVGSKTVVINEDLAIGSLVMKVKAVDGDFVEAKEFSEKVSVGRPIKYELLTNPGGYFKLDSETGELRVALHMDKEAFPLTNGVLTAKVRAFEVDRNQLFKSSTNDTSTTDLTITLFDVNDEVPEFNQHSHTVHVDENVPNGTPLSSLDLSIQDRDSGSNSAFNIALVDSSGIFSIEPLIATGSTSASIRVANGPLDYENPNQRKFILLVVATEAFTKEKFSSTSTVTVIINDVNDNAPSFDQETYTATVSEIAAPGTIITTIQATDRDSKNFLSYSLFGNGAELFYVNPSSGVVTVNHCSTPGRGNCLDYEVRSSYHLSFQADDGFGLSSVVSLIVNVQDANDNAPTFIRDNYQAIIDEFSTKFEPPLKVQAVDLDASSVLSYSIISGNLENLFSIEMRTGEIKVNQPVQSKEENITLIVQVSDGGKGVAFTRINIGIRDRNDNKPIFAKEEYIVTISESLPKGFFVEQVNAVDLDSGINAEIVYKIQRGAFEDFEIEELSGIIRVGENSKLDYDRRNFYEIEVIAADRGIPTKTGTTLVKVNLLNYNNKAPYFQPTNQRAEINEAANLNTKFHVMTAIDPDVNHSESLRYSIESATAIDRDGKPVNETKEKRFMDFFSVDVLTAEVFVASKLDRSIAAVVNLNMSVRDISVVPNQLGFGNLWINIIQYNKYPPSFGKPWSRERPDLTFSIRENQPIGTVLTNLIATDKDSKISHYQIDPQNDYFAIEPESGVITVKKNIDYELLTVDQLGRARISFNVYAFDNGLPQLSCVANILVNVININDAVPKFNKSYYEAEIEENIQWNSLILKVKATDEDAGKYGRITYSLLNGERNFVIDSLTGEIRVAAGANLDREKGPISYTLQVVATDGGGVEDSQSISVPVYITILDTNDCSPQFHQRVYNSNILGHIDSQKGQERLRAPVIQLTATDPDEGENGQVTYKILNGNINDIFEIDTNNGVIYAVKSPLSINANIKEYVLRVEARDQNGHGPYFDEAKVVLNVVEMNRNRPKFVVPTTSSIEIEENLPTGIRILKVEAIDEDEGLNGEVKYSIKEGDENVQENSYVKIDPQSGEIYTKIIFDRENKSEYELILSAQDQGHPQSFETLQKLKIIIKDIDDNSPQFNQREPYIFKIDENSERGTFIGSVKAIDLDQITYPIFYYIVDGNSGQSFYIEKISGLIYANATFDHEKQKVYELVIKATNDADLVYNQREWVSNRLTVKDRSFHVDDKSLAFVKVIINDLNDQQPFFEKQVYKVSINYKSAIGEVVTRVKAVDTDDEPYSSLVYNIVMTDLFRKNQPTSVRPIPSPFNLTNDGRILTTQLMTQYPIDSRFVLSIEAREKITPHRVTQAKVNIWLYDVSKLLKITIKLDPATVNAKREEVEQILSNATTYNSIISDIKYHMDYKTGKLLKNWSDIYVHFVDGIKEINPTRVIEILDSNQKLHRLKNIQIKKVSLAAALPQIELEDFDVPTAVLILLCTLLFVGLIATIVSCICLKTWYTMKLMKESIKLTAKKIQTNDLMHQDNDEIISLHGSTRMANGSVMERNRTETAQKRQQQPAIDNPLWSERGLKMYEEQELSMRLPYAVSQGDGQRSEDNESCHYTTLSERSRSRQRQPDNETTANVGLYQEM